MTRILSLSALLFATSLPSLKGAGYQLAERSAAGLGRAFSGESAIADDASVLGSNPAGMSFLDGLSFSAGFNAILADVDVDGDSALPSRSGPASQNGVIPESLVPYLYLTNQFSDHFSAGFGVYTTYGLRSDYSGAFADATLTNLSELISVNFNPALSFRIDESIAIGVGFDALYAEGELTSNSLSPIGLPATKVEGDDWGYGYNVGLMLSPTPETRLGLHYRSSISLNLEGSVEFTGVGPALEPSASLAVQLPDTLEVSIYHQLDEKWAVHGDILWTQWSKFQSLDVQTDNPTGTLGTQNPGSRPDLPPVREDWEDSFRYSMGATYTHNDRLTLRCGVAYDESPTRTEVRTLRIPDADRIWGSIGASYRLQNDLTVDLGYTHIFARDAQIRRSSESGNESFFSGKAEGKVNILALGVSGSF